MPTLLTPIYTQISNFLIWRIIDQITFNVDRTANRTEITKLTINRGKFEWVNEVKYFGVVFNTEETFTRIDVHLNSPKFLDASFVIQQKC